jgi:hypothetical protein
MSVDLNSNFLGPRGKPVSYSLGVSHEFLLQATADVVT